METTKKRHELYFIVLLILAVAYVCYLIYLPFLYDFLIAASAAAIMKPLYNYLQKKTNENNNLSAALCTIILTLIILGPTALLVSSITSEAFATASFIHGQIQSGNVEKLFQIQQYPWLQDTFNYISQYIDINSLDLKGPIADQVSRMSYWIYQQGTELLASISLLLVHLFFILLAFFFFIRDSRRILRIVSRVSPISPENEAIIVHKFTDVSRAIFRGAFLTAILQGSLVGLGFAVLGITGPVFWAFISSFFALMPLGTVVVWLPASIILFVTGSYWQAIALFVWGTLIVGSIDNLLRPYLMGNRTHLPAIVIFFAVLGGINQFGTMGIVIGPMITLFFLTLLEMYGVKIKSGENPKKNADGLV